MNEHAPTTEHERDREAYQRLFGEKTEPGSPYEDFNPDDYKSIPGTALHGAEAAAAGRALLEKVAGGPEMLDRATSGRGRPSLESDEAAGQSKQHQVRFGAELDSQLTTYAQHHGMNISEVIRQFVRNGLAQAQPRH